MLTVEEALEKVLAATRRNASQLVAVQDALGMALAESILSDVDSPPYDKSLMDGFAVRSADLAKGQARLEVVEEITAGAVPTRPVAPGQATQIMTGAPIPEGADAVVMIERTEVGDSGSPPGTVLIHDEHVRAGQNILPKATSMRREEEVLKPGRLIRAAEIGLLSEVGRVEVEVTTPAEVSVLATGNELVPPDEFPGAGRIRNSNGPMLAAAVERAGGTAKPLGIARDDVDELERLMREGLESDVLILSGGVSAGVLDLVPQCLEQLGVVEVFHGVLLKPGKPLWFGTLPRESGRDTLVFGLPGNPVSSLVCFELFVRPAIAAIGGHAVTCGNLFGAKLTDDHSQRGDRPVFFPAKLHFTETGLEAQPLQWHGSADLRTVAEADALAYFPAGQRNYAAGEIISVRLLT